MVALRLSTCLCACRWYLVVFNVLTPTSLPNVTKNSEVHWGPLSVSTADGILKLFIQCSMKILAIIVAVVFVVVITLASSEYPSVITTIYSFLLLFSDKGPDMSIWTKSGGPTEEDNRSLCCFLLFRRIHVHEMHLEAVLYTFLGIWGQWKSCRKESNNRRSPGCLAAKE